MGMEPYTAYFDLGYGITYTNIYNVKVLKNSTLKGNVLCAVRTLRLLQTSWLVCDQAIHIDVAHVHQ